MYCEPIARKAGFPSEAAFLETLGAVIAGVGTVVGVAAGGTPLGGVDGTSDMVRPCIANVSGRVFGICFRSKKFADPLCMCQTDFH